VIERIEIAPRGPGLHEFTPEVERVVARAGARRGGAHRHCSLDPRRRGPPRPGRLAGIYLWEHRRAGGPRSVLVHLGA
jgi:thiamine phosphate synthase YjbQ (UPF0047 family)